MYSFTPVEEVSTVLVLWQPLSYADILNVFFDLSMQRIEEVEEESQSSSSGNLSSIPKTEVSGSCSVS